MEAGGGDGLAIHLDGWSELLEASVFSCHCQLLASACRGFLIKRCATGALSLEILSRGEMMGMTWAAPASSQCLGRQPDSVCRTTATCSDSGGSKSP